MSRHFKKLYSWLKSKIKPSRSTGTRKGMPAPSLQQSPQDIPSSATLHRTCQLPLDAFIRAHCRADFSGLIISGSPNDQEILDAWNEIVFEFSGLIRSESTEAQVSMAREIGLLQHHLKYVEYACVLLSHRYDIDVINELIRMGYDGEYPENDQAGMDWQLGRVKSLSKTYYYDLEQLIDQYTRMLKTQDGKKQSEEDFVKNLAMLSKYQGYRLDRYTMTTEEYAIIFSNYLNEFKHHQNQGSHV